MYVASVCGDIHLMKCTVIAVLKHITLFPVSETRQKKELGDVGIADPYHMHDNNLSSKEGCEIILKECIFPALQKNKDKKYILVPYNPT
jgi:hypothetical protein